MWHADQLQVLRDELTNDPTVKGYATYLADAPGIVVDMINAQTERMAQERWVTGLTILSECSDLGPSIVRKLKAASLQDAVVEIAWHRLLGPTGLNINDAATLANIDGMVQAGTLVEAEAGQLKTLAIQPASRAQLLGLPSVTLYDLIDAGLVK